MNEAGNEITISLTRPITAHGEEVSELTFVRPVTKDRVDLGDPRLIHVDGVDVAIEIRTKVVAAYISRLARIPSSSVTKLAFADFETCSAVILSFFSGGDGGATENS
jgi:hypothetical protein